MPCVPFYLDIISWIVRFCIILVPGKIKDFGRCKMIPEIQKILYATDLSENSAYALRYAIDTAIKHDAKIVILHVINEMISSYYPAFGTVLTDEKHSAVQNAAVKKIHQRLEELCEEQFKNMPEEIKRVVSIEVCKGYPVEEILEKANELNCDVIIMGSHGKGKLKHTFLGNVALRVLKRSRKPVFIIPLPE
jgi:nucleotide-binding universal stress UspA family protein